MERRNFLKMMFGGVIAAAAGPRLVRAAVPARLDFRAIQIAQDFNLSAGRSVLIHLPGPTALSQFSIRFAEDCLYESITDALANLSVEVLIKDRTFVETPAFRIVTSGMFGSGARHAFPDPLISGFPRRNLFKSPLVADGDLCIKLTADPEWKPASDVRGRFLLDGLYDPREA